MQLESVSTSLRKEHTEQSQRNEVTSRYDDPEFEFGVANITNDAPKDEGPKLKKVEDTKRELQDILNLQDNQEWVDWARSEMVKPWWTELWDDHLSKNNEKKRRKGIGDIQNRILSGEAHGVVKYSTARPCKDAADRPGKDAQESYIPVIFYRNDL